MTATTLLANRQHALRAEENEDSPGAPLSFQEEEETTTAAAAHGEAAVRQAQTRRTHRCVRSHRQRKSGICQPVEKPTRLYVQVQFGSITMGYRSKYGIYIYTRSTVYIYIYIYI